MAEGENKSEKKVVEMSVWFALLIIVIVIATFWIFSLKSSLSSVTAERDDLQQTVTRLSKENSDRATLIRDIRIMATDGSLSQQKVMEKLKAA